MKFKTTIKADNEETILNMKSRQRGIAYDPNGAAKTTIKEIILTMVVILKDLLN